MLVMIGLWIAMQNAELLVWGGVAKSVPTPFPTAPWSSGPVSVSPLRVFVFVASVFLILGAHLLLARTRLGRAMRATFQDRETAALMGVSIERIHTITFAFGAGLAAAAGALLGPGLPPLPLHGRSGVAEGLLGGDPRRPRQLRRAPPSAASSSAWPRSWARATSRPGYRDAVGFVIIVAVLLVRPSGLFARAERVG